jgi:DNA-binding transcriptional regulator/RsmH inhibitor MraZ
MANKRGFLCHAHSNAWPDGEIRYVVSKSLVSRTRLDKQIAFVSAPAGKAFWEETRVGFVQRPNTFRLLHNL